MSDDTPKISGFVAFIHSHELTRMMEHLRDRYLELGKIGGNVHLVNVSTQERHEIASFLARRVETASTLIISLSDVDAQLRQSVFACTLLDALTELFPEGPLLTRAAQRKQRMEYRQAFLSELQQTAKSFEIDSPANVWLERGAHGAEWLFTLYRDKQQTERNVYLLLITLVGKALNAAPWSQEIERLAMFARRMSGDPHCFDRDIPTGRLLLLALGDLAVINEYPVSSDFTGSSASRSDEITLYRMAGLEVDTLSTWVAAWCIQQAILSDDTVDPMIVVAGRQAIILPLRHIQQWQNVVPMRSHVFLVENPQVFESIIDADAITSMRHPPTIICTSGWPGSAALSLLDILTKDRSTILLYSGDFDLGGLQIAAFLYRRYPDHVQFWRYDPDSYSASLHHQGADIEQKGHIPIADLPVQLHPVAKAMQKRNGTVLVGYQEGIVDVLIYDILSA